MKTQPVMRPLKRRPSSPLTDVTCFEELAKIISDESDTDDSTPDSGKNEILLGFELLITRLLNYFR